MSHSSLNILSIDTLFELLVPAVKELLEAIESNDEITIKVKKKQCESLYNGIVNTEIGRKMLVERTKL